MRRISANYIFPVTSTPLKNGIIELDDQGTLKNIIDTGGKLSESRNLEFYNGVIVPGFINTHCHIEISDLKGQIKEKQSLVGFIRQMAKSDRSGTAAHYDKSLQGADYLMRKNGIVAVGDISNTTNSISLKKQSKIYYHTFIELVGLDLNTQETFDRFERIRAKFAKYSLPVSITPHAPYSVTRSLFHLIVKDAEKRNSLLSIHNQETASENDLFINGTGALVNLFRDLNLNLEGIEISGKDSVQTILKYLPKNNQILFVHNTYSTLEDIKQIDQNLRNFFFCLCPKSNLHIENRLPDLNNFTGYHDRITFGTDSLASNDTLSILEEMKIIHRHFPEIDFNKLIQWATINGARALKIDNLYGGIEIGKAPGINLISHFDFTKMQITERSEVKVLA